MRRLRRAGLTWSPGSRTWLEEWSATWPGSWCSLRPAGLAAGARLRHEALICLTFIGVGLLLDLQWPLQLNEPTWWALFTAGLIAYVGVRRKICN